MQSQRQLIAVAVDRNGAVAGHAGRVHHFLVFDAWPGESPELAYALTLEDHACLHEWHVCEFPERHPLHAVDVVIAASAGEGVTRRLEERKVRMVTTSETDPAHAATLFRAGTLPPGLPHEACAEHEHA